MKFCLSVEIQEGLDYAVTQAFTQAGEAAGFDAGLLAEHYYASSGHLHRIAADAWVFLGALARDTQHIRLGTLVSPVTFRHPAVLAKMAATLDHLSGGRAELGLGADCPLGLSAPPMRPWVMARRGRARMRCRGRGLGEPQGPGQ